MTTTFQFDTELNAPKATGTEVSAPFAAQERGIKPHQFLTDMCRVDTLFANETNPREACGRAVLQVIGEATRRILESWRDIDPHAGDFAIQGNLLNLRMLLGENVNETADILHMYDALDKERDESTLIPQWLEYFQQSQEDTGRNLTDQWRVGALRLSPRRFWWLGNDSGQ